MLSFLLTESFGLMDVKDLQEWLYKYMFVSVNFPLYGQIFHWKSL